MAWTKIPAVDLNLKARKSIWPAALASLIEITLENLSRGNAKNEDLRMFLLWKRAATYRITKSDGQQFYIGIYGFGGKRMSTVAEKTPRAFSQWGFLAHDLPLRSVSSKTEAPRTKLNRREALQQLIDQRETFSVEDYLHRLNESVTRRQAQRDLLECKQLKKIGQTRARLYKPK